MHIHPKNGGSTSENYVGLVDGRCWAVQSACAYARMHIRENPIIR